MAHNDPAMARALMAALVCLRGTIFLYQGDELGLPDAHVPFERLRDPFAIAAYAGGAGRDGARTPMPWTSSAPMGGFTAAQDAWLPMDPAHLPLAIERQEAQPDSMLHFVRRLLGVRKGSNALKTGAAVPLPTPANVLGFERIDGGERVRCYVELGGAPTTFEAGDLSAAEALLLEGGARPGPSHLELPPYAVAVLRL
jgi:alpha-glucosidase